MISAVSPPVVFTSCSSPSRQKTASPASIGSSTLPAPLTSPEPSSTARICVPLPARWRASRPPGANRKTAAWKGERSEIGAESGAIVTRSNSSSRGVKATSASKLNRSTNTSLSHTLGGPVEWSSRSPFPRPAERCVLAHRSVWSAHLRTGQEALLLHEPRMALVATPSASGDLGVLARPAHDLPRADADTRGEIEACDLFVRDLDELGPLPNRHGPSLAFERVGIPIDRDVLPLAHHVGLLAIAEAYRARVALERPGLLWREHERAVTRVLHRNRNPLFRCLGAGRRNGRQRDRRNQRDEYDESSLHCVPPLPSFYCWMR